jgi:hypothetical protein
VLGAMVASLSATGHAYKSDRAACPSWLSPPYEPEELEFSALLEFVQAPAIVIFTAAPPESASVGVPPRRLATCP